MSYAMDVDAHTSPVASTSLLAMDVDEKPDGPALLAGEAATPSGSGPAKYTKDGQRILKEMPLYFTTELAEYLSLLQYPHRWRPRPGPNQYSEHSPLVPISQEKRDLLARIKPKVGTLELSVPLEGGSYSTFSKTKGAEMGKGVEVGDLGGPQPAPGKKKANPEEAKPLEKMTFRAEPLADQTNYCVGILANDEYHLTPLLSTMQLRASLTYLDHNRARERDRKARGADDDQEGSTSEESDDGIEEGDRDEFEAKKQKLADVKPDAKPVAVSMRSEAGLAGDKGVGRATSALFAPYKADQIEPWLPLSYYSSKTAEADQVSAALFCQHPEQKLETTTSITEHLTHFGH